VRTSLLLGTLIVACAAGAGILLLDRGGSPPEAPDTATDGQARRPAGDPAIQSGDAHRVLREWHTPGSLREDLRDTLAGPPAALESTFAEVSARLAGAAETVLASTAPGEASPRVRALLVLAAGRHRPDDPRLLGFLADRFPVVREAAALAAGWSGRDDAQVVEALAGVRVPIGRALPAPTAAALRAALVRETDAQVRATGERVLAGG